MSAFFARDFIEGVEGVPFPDSFTCKIEAPEREFSLRQWTDDFEAMYDGPCNIKTEAQESDSEDQEGFLCQGEEEGMRLMQKYSQLTKRKPIESMRKKVATHNRRNYD
jgi:hypothetical protein